MTEKKEEPKKKNSIMQRQMQSYKSRSLRGIRNIVGIVLIICIVLFFLAGGINQVKTGESIISYALNIGKNISYGLNSLFTEDSPLKVNEDGIYLKDVEPPKNAGEIQKPDTDAIKDTVQDVKENIETESEKEQESENDK